MTIIFGAHETAQFAIEDVVIHEPYIFFFFSLSSPGYLPSIPALLVSRSRILFRRGGFCCHLRMKLPMKTNRNYV